MGNVEIKDRPRKANSIFGQRNRPSSRSPFRDLLASNSPYYRDISPIRYSPISRDRRSNFKQSLRADTSARKSPKPQEKETFIAGREKGRRQADRVEEDMPVINAENKEKCEEIIRKVRNFNDFLVELKRKLREDCSASEKHSERSEVSLSVKLENERVELEKYKKLVERELSKTHSIENISIQNVGNGEKILTIQYEDFAALHHRQDHHENSQEEQHNIPENHHFAETRRDNGEQSAVAAADSRDNQTLTARLLQISKNNESVESRETKGPPHEKKIKEARSLWTILQKKTRQLGELLAKQEQLQQGGEELRDYLVVKERLVKVNELYASIESTKRQSLEVERKIRDLLA